MAPTGDADGLNSLTVRLLKLYATGSPVNAVATPGAPLSAIPTSHPSGRVPLNCRISSLLHNYSRFRRPWPVSASGGAASAASGAAAGGVPDDGPHRPVDRQGQHAREQVAGHPRVPADADVPSSA